MVENIQVVAAVTHCVVDFREYFDRQIAMRPEFTVSAPRSFDQEIVRISEIGVVITLMSQ
jgi:hypothetical protein